MNSVDDEGEVIVAVGAALPDEMVTDAAAEVRPRLSRTVRDAVQLPAA